jgi:hypothetical protein
MATMFEVKTQGLPFVVADLERVFGIDDHVKAQVLRDRGQYGYRASTLVWDPGQRLDRAARYLLESTKYRPTDADLLCSFAILAALRGDRDFSLARWREAYALEPGTTLGRGPGPGSPDHDPPRGQRPAASHPGPLGAAEEVEPDAPE